MNRKNVAKLVLAGAFLWALNLAPTFASGNIWMDEHAQIQAKQYKKVVVFPLRYLDAAYGKTDEFQGYNGYICKDLSKRVKKVNFLGFGDQLEEKKQIIRDNPAYQALPRQYDTEEERAKAVYETTAADGYLLPHLRWEGERIDVSPATWTSVKMESYYNITNGPHGDEYRKHYHSYWKSHLIPEYRLRLQMLDMDFTLYDAYTGKKAMTRIDYYRAYGADQWAGVRSISKQLAKDWAKLRKDKDHKVSSHAPTLGFRHFNLPADVGQNEFAIKTIYYAIKDEAGDRLKKVKVDYSPDGGDYYVTGDVYQYDRGESWVEPRAAASPHLVHEETFTWRDRQGKSHTGRRSYYRTREEDITDYHGYYTFWYRVGMNLRLVDARTGQVIYSKSGENTNDYYGDALRSILKDFYKDVDKLIGDEDF